MTVIDDELMTEIHEFLEMIMADRDHMPTDVEFGAEELLEKLKGR